MTNSLQADGAANDRFGVLGGSGVCDNETKLSSDTYRTCADRLGAGSGSLIR